MKSLDQPLFVRVLEEIRNSVDLSEKEFSELIGATPKYYSRILEGRKPLTPDLIAKTSQQFHISTDAIFSGKIDHLALSAQFHGNISILPERYADQTHHFARTRSTLTLIDYLKSLHGSAFVHQTLRRLQLRGEMFQDPESPVHPLIVTDLFDDLERSGFHPELFREMGKATLNINKKTQVNSVLSKTRNPRELYEVLHDQIQHSHYDRLFHYEIKKITNSLMHTSVRPKKDAHDALGLKLTGERHTCLYKQGVYASFMGHIGQPFPRILETKCLYLGDSECKYAVSWD